MGALMLVAFLFLFKTAPIGLRVAWGAFYALAFIPLTYWIDRTTYRTYLTPRRAPDGQEELARLRRPLAAGIVAVAGPRREQQEDARAAVAARSECRSSGSNRTSVPGPAMIVSLPSLISTSPSTTVTQAFSFTWWSPSAWPG